MQLHFNNFHFFFKKFKMPFSVFRNLHLNSFPSLHNAVAVEEIKMFRSFCFLSAPLIMSLTLPRSGFVPGETIDISLDFNNRSSISVAESRFVLHRVTIFKSNMPEKELKWVVDDLVTAFSGGVAARSRAKIETKLNIPCFLMPTSDCHCTIIRIIYALKVEAKVRGFRSSVEMIIPITMGSKSWSSSSKGKTGERVREVTFKNTKSKIGPNGFIWPDPLGEASSSV